MLTKLTMYRYSDATRVVDFFAAASREDRTLRPVPTKEWLNFIHQGQVQVVLCEHRSGIIAGLLTTQLVVRENATNRHFCIFVAPELRRQGLGSILFEYLRSCEPVETGMWLECRTQQDWHAGEGFLKRNQFSPWRTWLNLKCEVAAAPPVAPVQGYSLRRLLPTAPVLCDLERIAKTAHAVEIHHTADDLRRQHQAGMTFLALQDSGERIAGYCAYEHADGNNYWIDNLVVDPSLHRIGLGRWLLASLISDLKELQATVGLQCEATNANALALYYSYGFVESSRSTLFRGLRREHQ